MYIVSETPRSSVVLRVSDFTHLRIMASTDAGRSMESGLGTFQILVLILF